MNLVIAKINRVVDAMFRKEAIENPKKKDTQRKKAKDRALQVFPISGSGYGDTPPASPVKFHYVDVLLNHKSKLRQDAFNILKEEEIPLSEDDLTPEGKEQAPWYRGAEHYFFGRLLHKVCLLYTSPSPRDPE